MAHLAEGEIEREAKRILPRLQPEHTCLLQIDDRRFGLFIPKNKWRKPMLHVSQDMVQALMARELLWRVDQDPPYIHHKDGEVSYRCYFRLSDVGRHWVRRLAPSETTFLDQHRVAGRRFIRDHDKANADYHVNAVESPLGWLQKRKGPDGAPLISEAEFEAGEKLRDDFTRAQLSSRVTADWSGMPIQSKTRRAAPDALALNDAVIAAKRRVEKALEAVGPGLADALIETCCLLHGMEQAERNMGWPQRSGKVVLQIALARLAEHYGMMGSVPRSRPVRLWQADDDPVPRDD